MNNRNSNYSDMGGLDKIYIVTAGDYSDYHIEAVFSTKEKAKEFVQHNGMKYRIKEYALDGKPDLGVKIWYVSIDIDNNKVINAEVCIMKGSEFELKDECVIRSFLREKRCSLYIETDTMNRAIKIAKERYFALKSNQYIWDKMNTKKKVQTSYSRTGRIEYPFFNFVTNEFSY